MPGKRARLSKAEHGPGVLLLYTMDAFPNEAVHGTLTRNHVFAQGSSVPKSFAALSAWL